MQTSASDSATPTPLTIAVVDDDPGVLQFFDEVIRSLGHRILPFESGQTLWMHDHLDRIDLFILDLNLPLMNGMTLAQSLRGRPEVQNKQIIALTGGGFASPAEAFRAGFDDYWMKPLHLGLLYSSIQKCLAGRLPASSS
ncbi:MAG: response regulator [Pseudomonadota bacterium]